MPSTTSSSVSSDLASSTVITPSLPTFSIAWAIISPISRSPLAEMVPTWAISSLVETFFERFFISSTMASTAMSTPRFRSIGFMPAATALAPSRTIAWARTVAVVVPSPAMSVVLQATSRTICAPIFSNLSASSISLATVTPSLVIARRAERLVENDIAALGSQRHLDRVGEDVDAAQHPLARIAAEFTSLAAMFTPPSKRLFSWQPAAAPSMTPMMSDSFMIR